MEKTKKTRFEELFKELHLSKWEIYKKERVAFNLVAMDIDDEDGNTYHTGIGDVSEMSYIMTRGLVDLYHQHGDGHPFLYALSVMRAILKMIKEDYRN